MTASAMKNGANGAALDTTALARLADEVIQQLQRGEQVDPAVLASRYPDHAEKVCELLPAIQALADLSKTGDRTVPLGEYPLEDSADSPGTNRELGDFRILRQIGRGGMGIVYEAEQISLRRRVALKVLPFAAILDERAKKRFQNEALAAAQLDHPHIVDVYGVGCERGVHYYAMRLIEGRSLSDIVQHLREQFAADPHYSPTSLADLANTARPATNSANESSRSPTASILEASETVRAIGTRKSAPKLGQEYYRAIAILGMHVAEALDHAHEQGVLHRDIKPSNLMLDNAGKVWITDFGLARVEASASLTHTGDLLGTLRYMSPEQTLAKRVPIDHRSDIYSLGVTIYELLTLQPVFNGENRGDLMRQIACDEPIHPRQIDSHIPHDLETVLLKAIEKNPNDRYQTAMDLAEDLKRFVEDRHIAARRPSLYSRAVKWSRRHVEWVVSVSLVAMILLAATTLVMYIAAARERERTTERLRLNQEIEQELRQSTSVAQQATSANSDERQLWGQANEHAQRAAALATNESVDLSLRNEVSKVLTDLDQRKRDWALLAAIDNAWLVQLDTTEGGDAPARDKVAPIFVDALTTFGIEIGHEPAKDAVDRIVSRPRDVQLAIITILDELLYYSDKTRDPWIEKVLSLVDPNAWRASKRAANKLAGPAERLAALQKLANDKDVNDQPAMLVCYLGVELHLHGDNAGGIAVMRNAAHRYPGDVQFNHYLSFLLAQASPPQFPEAARYATAAVALQPKNPILLHTLGAYLLSAGMTAEAVEQLRAGVRLKPDSARFHWLLGRGLLILKKQEEAFAECTEAIRLKPDDADAHTSLGDVLAEKGSLDASLAAHREAVRLDPRNAERHVIFGIVLTKKGNLKEAIMEFQESIHLNPNYASAHNNFGIALARQGNLDAAVSAYREAIRLKPDYFNAYSNLGNVLARQGKFDDAITIAREVIAREPKHAWAHETLWSVLIKKGKVDEAIAELREVVRLEPQNAIAHYNLGNSLKQKGMQDEAAEEYREAIRLQPNFPEAHCNLGHLLSAKGAFAVALETMRKGHELGSQKAGWRYPSASWVAELELRVKLDADFDRVLNESNAILTPNYRVEMATLAAKHKQLPATAFKWYVQAFSEDPALAENVQSGHRYMAACSALLTAGGKAKEAENLENAERARLKHQALVWLRDDLAGWEQLVNSMTPQQLPGIIQILAHWEQDPNLAILRDEQQVMRLPDEDQQLYRKLWVDHAKLVKQIREMASPIKK